MNTTTVHQPGPIHQLQAELDELEMFHQAAIEGLKARNLERRTARRFFQRAESEAVEHVETVTVHTDGSVYVNHEPVPAHKRASTLRALALDLLHGCARWVEGSR